MLLPGAENYTEITPEEFEQYTLDMLKKVTDGLEDVVFEHDVIIDTYDGSYQIDGRISYKALGCNIVMLVECKKYSGPVKREHIQILYDKVRSTGANKGIFVTTSYYQSGAYDYAKAHGIALLVIADGKINYEIRSRQKISEDMYPKGMPKFITIWQEKSGENSIRSAVVDGTQYFKEFLVTEI